MSCEEDGTIIRDGYEVRFRTQPNPCPNCGSSEAVNLQCANHIIIAVNQ